MKTRILVVDDHPLMRKGLALTLSSEPDLEVVGQAADAEEALRLFDQTTPDLVLVDVSLPGMNGLELVKHLVARQPDVKALVVSRHDETLYAERAVRAGAKGYISKLEADEGIVDAVRHVLRGGIFMSEELKDRLLFGAAIGRKEPMQSPLEVLSDRELEVFEMTGRGLPTREIAERLHLSVKTVESYRARIKTKLNLETGTELMQHAVRWVEGERAG
ncbi:MAG TPA: response regulator transcription factor [Rubricoccaceae bacterium]|nr:response regulator transcription factor [Rubricoccaceae bacterium]